jgi:hypothetical protein
MAHLSPPPEAVVAALNTLRSECGTWSQQPLPNHPDASPKTYDFTAEGTACQVAQDYQRFSKSIEGGMIFFGITLALIAALMVTLLPRRLNVRSGWSWAAFAGRCLAIGFCAFIAGVVVSAVSSLSTPNDALSYSAPLFLALLFVLLSAALGLVMSDAFHQIRARVPC